MPGFLHDVVVKMFRNSGELAREIAGLVVRMPDTELEARAAGNDLTAPMPVEYRADQVMAYHRKGMAAPELAIVVEVQHKVDERKRWTWMSYVANAAADHECRVLLLVVTWDGRVAQWARGPFESGHPDFDLKPLVIDLSKLPTLLTEEDARRTPELAVLCAIARRDAPSAEAAIPMLRELPSDRAALYWRAIASALLPSELLTLEKKMQTLEEWANDWSYFPRKFPRLTAMLMKPYQEKAMKKGMKEGMKKGKREGKREGQAKGRVEGRKEGRVEALQRAALKVLSSKLGKISAAESAKVRALKDTNALTALIVRLGPVADAKRVRAILARCSR